MVVVAHHQDSVSHGDAEERDESYQGSHVEHATGEPHGQDSADERQGQVHHDEEHLADGAELDEEKQKDRRQGKQAPSSRLLWRRGTG